ncbi:hypothetical protein SAMN05444374_11632 [Rhodococcoides kroppenstedtii]|uniref:Head-to-tail stopper n=1 Tax=Rhodococcoides kroppenstedtii TaxID=293050 RepID=A0A1I0U9P4_9NOCA|nr:hypothetical protein [Rhodococcus kroppenstedtii]SFA60819.1 hypothetical protein SAMN05444374_11632 [Rhodococcus kroppenstedtii]
MSRFGFTSTIAIKKPQRVADRYSNERLVYDDVEPVPVDDLVSLQPESSTEVGDRENRIGTVETFRLRTQPGIDLDLDSVDHVLWAGRELEVISEVMRWPHPMRPDGVHHLEATLRFVKG